jgi:hypothetical protein
MKCDLEKRGEQRALLIGVLFNEGFLQDYDQIDE